MLVCVQTVQGLQAANFDLVEFTNHRMEVDMDKVGNDDKFNWINAMLVSRCDDSVTTFHNRK
jgi:hypothetical protein